ncbi:hypothetical protein [Streptomyces sp. RKAG337]|uniref:hypothetical protein n=1 Tax=Streptomyces sp. RKAG337 TaxID=2893404 RepID=UPI0020337448|nr:hypothetical protein [Streptomyces sp. RKAG337]MCM2430347.1 hypothetical protein [Streptomyces sp. RKAG337]
MHGLTPQLSARVTGTDPSRPVRAQFLLRDNTDASLPQPVLMDGPGSDTLDPVGSVGSGSVAGSGTVRVSTPKLISGHSYGWYARTVEGPRHALARSSPTSAVCHFIAVAG